MNSPLRRIRICTQVVLLLAAACTSAPIQPTEPPSPTPAPTETTSPVATETPVPSPTDTPSPTPDHAATTAAQETEISLTSVADVGLQLEEYGYNASAGNLAWRSEEPASLTLTAYNSQDWIVAADQARFSDFIVKTDVTWKSTGGYAICGIWFRADSSEEDSAHYMFQTIRLSGFPSWDVEYWKFNEWQATLSPGGNVISTPHIDQEQGSTNTFVLAAEGNQVTLYANGHRLGIASITTLSEGLVAFYAWQDSGETTCTFGNAWIWDLTAAP